MTDSPPDRQDCVKFKAYKELHSRIGKTIQPTFTEKEACRRPPVVPLLPTNTLPHNPF